MQSGGSSCGTSFIAAPAMVMRCLTAETARKRTAGAGSQREEQRVDATRALTEGISQKLEEGSGGGDESRQQRTERKEGTMFEKTVYKLQNKKTPPGDRRGQASTKAAATAHLQHSPP
jgi:hypothetical protein